jgi:hypothetical protein
MAHVPSSGSFLETREHDRSRSPPLVHTTLHRGDNKSWSNFSHKSFLTSPVYITPSSWNFGSACFKSRELGIPAVPAPEAAALAPEAAAPIAVEPRANEQVLLIEPEAAAPEAAALAPEAAAPIAVEPRANGQDRP